MLVRWTSEAASDLEQITAHIQQDNRTAAQEVAQAIYQAVASLRNFPNRGRTGRVHGTRELVVGSLPYIIVYRTVQESVQVLRVYHGAQEWP